MRWRFRPKNASPRVEAAPRRNAPGSPCRESRCENAEYSVRRQQQARISARSRGRRMPCVRSFGNGHRAGISLGIRLMRTSMRARAAPHHVGVKSATVTGFQHELAKVAIAGAQPQHMVDEIELHVKSRALMRDRRRARPRAVTCKGCVPGMVEPRRQREPHLAITCVHRSAVSKCPSTRRKAAQASGRHRIVRHDCPPDGLEPGSPAWARASPLRRKRIGRPAFIGS